MDVRTESQVCVLLLLKRRIRFSLVKILVLNCKSSTGGSEMPFPITRHYPMPPTPHWEIWLQSREVE